MTESKSPPDSMQHLEEALRVAGRRPTPSSEATRIAQAGAELAWERVVRRRRSRRARRALMSLAAAVLIIFGATWLWFAGTVSSPGPVTVPFSAVVERVTGHATIEGASGIRELRAGVTLVAGTHISTGDGRLAMKRDDGVSLRLDRHTRVELRSDGTYRLGAGRLYVDTGAVAAGVVRIDTPLGALSDIGTQFQAHWLREELKVDVREGAVELDGPAFARTARVAAGQSLVGKRGSPSRITAMAADADDWRWAAELASAPPASQQSLTGVLEWVCRELGCSLRYADERSRAAATRVVLDGSIAGLTPRETLAALARITTLHYRLDGNALFVEAAHAIR